MSIIDLFNWLADENNNRALSSLGTIFQIFGFIIPALVGIVIFIIRSNRRARDDVLNFMKDWNALEKNVDRIRALEVFRKFRGQAGGLYSLPNDSIERMLTNSFLNEL